MLVTVPPAVQVLSTPPSPTSPCHHVSPKPRNHNLDRFTSRAESHFRTALTPETLQMVAERLRSQFNEALQSSTMAMLPSFCHTLPTGQEEGDFLALDVGGSTLRIALVRLRGLSAPSQPIEVLKRRDFIVDDEVRCLVGLQFFDWIADRIQDSFGRDTDWLSGNPPLRMGLAWSFPIGQTSIRDGGLLPMGKGFRATEGLLGRNLADLVSDACHKKNLNIEVSAMVNDSSSSLLSGAYMTHACSPIALVLGTGLNATIHVPVGSLSPSKLGNRPASWHAAAHHVLVNTELSLFGRHAFPTTRWDEALKRAHAQPDFQPLEHLTSGRYLGEIVRLVLVDAIQTAGLFDGRMPCDFGPYALSTETVARIEADDTASLTRAAAVLSTAHPLPANRRYTPSDMAHVRRIVELVSSRAAAYLATSVHALCELRTAAERHADPAATPTDTIIGCDGSVLDKYPSFRARVQRWLDALRTAPGYSRVRLEPTRESALLGAAVAVACQCGGEP